MVNFSLSKKICRQQVGIEPDRLDRNPREEDESHAFHATKGNVKFLVELYKLKFLFNKRRRETQEERATK
jgi:hypothetical protein